MIPDPQRIGAGCNAAGSSGARDYLADKLNRLDFIKIDIEVLKAGAPVGLRDILAKPNTLLPVEFTLSSFDLFSFHGGLQMYCLSDFDLRRAANPAHLFGVFRLRATR